MKVQDVMTSNVGTCRPETNLAEAAMMMWDGDCGVLPVVDDQGKVVAMITDRDIAIAAATNDRPASHIAVHEAMSGTVSFVLPDEDIRTALKTMRHDKVRRLPVLDHDGHLKGLLSVNDIVCRAEEPRGKTVPEITYEEAMGTIKAICEHRSHHTESKA